MYLFAAIVLLLFDIVAVLFGKGVLEGASMDYWSNRQCKFWKGIGICINAVCLIIIALAIIVWPNRFSESLHAFAMIIAYSGVGITFVFFGTIHIIAWKKKTDILRMNIREAIEENEDITDSREMLRICLNENRFHFTQKQIRRNFTKLWLRMREGRNGVDKDEC